MSTLYAGSRPSAGLDEGALGCPAQLPLDEPAAHVLLAAGGGRSALAQQCRPNPRL
jgi:hypothetical protein